MSLPEQTKPEAAVSQEAPDSMERAIERLTQPEGQGEAPEGTQESEQSAEHEATQGQAEPEEVTPEDIPEDQPAEQPAVDAFEIIHNGQPVKLTREDTIKYAMQGFDYTQKTQQVAAKDRFVEQRLQQVSELEQLAPVLATGLAQVQSLQAQLRDYEKVDWVQLAATNPMEYPKYRAQYDVLKEGLNTAMTQFNQGYANAKQRMAALNGQQLQQEVQELPKYVPEWRDPNKLGAAQQEIARHYEANYGISPQALDSSLKSALALSVAYKAMKYDQLVKSKADKSKTLRQTPPLTVPGASNPSVAKAGKAKELQTRLKKSGSMEDAVALLLNR